MQQTANELLEKDLLFRWRVMGFSIGVTALSGYASESFGVPERWAELLAGGLGCLSFWGLTLFLLARNSRKVHPSQGVLRQRHRSLAFKFPAIAGLALVLLLLLAPTLKAAVLNHRLQKILDRAPSTSRAAETVRVLEIAARSHTHLRSDLVEIAKKQALLTQSPGVTDKTGSEKPMYTTEAQWDSYVSNVAKQFNDRHSASKSPNSNLMTFKLGNGTITDSYFGDTSVIYEGLPVSIHHLCFEYVELHVIRNDNGEKLLKAFADSNDGCISVEIENPDLGSYSPLPQAP